MHNLFTYPPLLFLNETEKNWESWEQRGLSQWFRCGFSNPCKGSVYPWRQDKSLAGDAYQWQCPSRWNKIVPVRISTSQVPSVVSAHLQICSPEMVKAHPEPDLYSGASLSLTSMDFLGQLIRKKGHQHLEKGVKSRRKGILGNPL